MDRLSIINYLIEKNSYESYSELGVFIGYTLDGCVAKNKIGVDPQCGHYKGSNNIFCGTSDEFFAKLPEDKKFQIFFIDGLHESSQVDKDIQNSLKHLNPGGIIVLHDMNPPTELHTTTGDKYGNWNGDCYRSFLRLGGGFQPFIYYVIDTDWGVGIIKPITPIEDKDIHISLQGGVLDVSDLDYKRAETDWDYFDKNRKDLLNLITPEEFLKRESITTILPGIDNSLVIPSKPHIVKENQSHE